MSAMRFGILLLILTRALLAGEAVSPRKVAATEGGVLYRYADRRVLVVRGTPRQMGLAHGRLLKKQVEANTRAFVHEWALGRMGRTRAELEAIWDRIARHIPAHYLLELQGLAEGSGVPLDDLQLLHAIPSRYHCTGTAATPAVTRDGKVYHTRSLDYALDIGETVRPQTNSLLLVAVPDDGLPHAVVTWAGFLGCVTGMNLKGVSVGEMGSKSSDESYDGVPMIFLLREVLLRAQDIGQAKAIWTKGPRTCGYNFIFCDPREICAVECNRSRIRFFGPGDATERISPHTPIEGIVRRCNHFVDPRLAATQRRKYDPRTSAGASWTAYSRQGELLRRASGAIDAETMMSVLRGYPVSHPCLHQAVLCPNDLVLYVSQATDPAVDPMAGAQNQPFFRYDLRALVAGHPALAHRFGTDRSVPKGVETGRVEDAPRIKGVFAHKTGPFAFRREPVRRLGEVTISHLTFPSPGPSRYPENLTVHAEYYRPKGKGPFPAAVVLHILDGRFYVARLVASALAQRGVAALFIQLPYYGDRRPREVVDLRDIDLPEVVTAIQQAVRDVRRGAAWLRQRPDVDGKQVGIVGVSLGSFIAQLAAGADGGFDRCAFVLGGGSIIETVYSGSKDTRKMEAILKQRGWTREKAQKVLERVEPARFVKGISSGGVLMINCRSDEVVPPASTERYWESIGKPNIVWFAGGHSALKNHLCYVMEGITANFAW